MNITQYFYIPNKIILKLNRGVVLKKTNVKIIGIFVCILFLGTLVPTAVAEKQTDDQIQPTAFLHRRLMVFGYISNFTILDDTIIGHADQLIYYGRGILHHDRGIITNRQIILQMANQHHIWKVGTDLIILGQCIILI
jgi:hypothetical protein